MDRAQVYLATIVLLYVAVSFSTADCPFPDCECSGRYINCHNRGFDQIPPLNASSVNSYEVLRLESNLLITITDNSLPAGLTEIDFGDNPISDISPGAFNNTATTLEILSFSNCPLKEIPDAFLSLTRLTSLTIKNAPVRNWKPDVLKHIGTSLKVIVLNNVGLMSWPAWFQYLPSLTTLSLTYSRITPIPDTAFDQFASSLEVLVFAFTGLGTVPKALTTLKNLRTLDLTGNRINEVGNLPYLSRLQTLSLAHNNISDVNKLEEEISSHADTLTYLYLYNNLLPSIPHLENMSALEVVNIDNNQIKDNSGSLPVSLTSLQLRQNQLSSIPDLVRNLPNLRNLLLSENSIQVIPSGYLPTRLLNLEIKNNAINVVNDGIFPSNSSLKYLYLDGNPIGNVTASAFVNLSQLQILGLQNTSLTRLPLALSGLNSLSTLDLANNACLVCSCDEAGLATWFESRPGLTVQGTCGDIVISEFLDGLATQCPGKFA